jgi:hypothetical protein
MLHPAPRHARCWSLFVSGILSFGPLATAAAVDEPAEGDWRALPLVADGELDPAWRHLWGGGFSVMDDGSVRTDCTDEGMGVLLYTREKFGDCQIRVVYRTEDARDNAGVFVRIADGVLDRADDPLPPRERGENGRLTPETIERLQAASEAAREAWYPVHHGYEIQICDTGDAYHRTGAVYSLAPAATAPKKPPGEWKTMIITLTDDRIRVAVDGKQLTTFDPGDASVPDRQEWYEPRREPRRPPSGFIGLQNHDPGDVVYFREVSVRAGGRDKVSG